MQAIHANSAESLACGVCGEHSEYLDVVDFNKSCMEAHGRFLPVSGRSVYYALCDRCGYCFAPELRRWTPQQFREHIYNDQYELVDPDFVEARPAVNARNLLKMFEGRAAAITHLDFGGGAGRLSELLRAGGWQSRSCDPFQPGQEPLSTLGRFNLVTAYEVFEHVPDPAKLMTEILSLLEPNGLVLLSTLVSDGHLHRRRRLRWWYASPRNGHISLFSRHSLARLAELNGFHFGSFDNNLHAFFTRVPDWAKHVIKVA